MTAYTFVGKTRITQLPDGNFRLEGDGVDVYQKLTECFNGQLSVAHMVKNEWGEAHFMLDVRVDDTTLGDLREQISQVLA